MLSTYWEGKVLGTLRAWDKVWNRMYNMLFFGQNRGKFLIYSWRKSGRILRLVEIVMCCQFPPDSLRDWEIPCPSCSQYCWQCAFSWQPTGNDCLIWKGALLSVVMTTPWMAWIWWMINMGVWWANSPCLTQSNSLEVPYLDTTWQLTFFLSCLLPRKKTVPKNLLLTKSLLPGEANMWQETKPGEWGQGFCSVPFYN